MSDNTDIIPENVPDGLRERRQWMLWDSAHDAPRRPGGWADDTEIIDWYASWQEPTDWLTFEDAVEAAATKESYGVGFVFRTAGDWIPIDVDGCLIDPHGELKDWVPSLDSFAGETYIEYSPSGDGLHIYVEHRELPPWWTDQHFTDEEHEGLEAYENKFFTITGDQHPESTDSIEAVNPDGFLWNGYTAVAGETPDLKNSVHDVNPDENGGHSASSEDIDVSCYDILQESKYPGGERCAHPYHGSGTGSNFHVNDDGETFRCWRSSHSATGNGLHLLGMDEGIINCGDWVNGGLSSDTWSEIFDAARERGLDVPEREQTRQQPSATADGGVSAATPTGSNTEDAAPGETWLSPEALAAVAHLDVDEDESLASAIGNLNDREAAAWVWDLVDRSADVFVRALRESDELWAYDDDRGVWTAEGERALRHAARQTLTSINYGGNVLSELKTQPRGDPDAELESDDLGLEPGYVAVENGLLDLDTESITSHSPEDYALTRLPVEYDSEASYEEWDELVTEWAEEGRADALQEYVGYCLHIGALPIHRALLLVGSGANGKGVFLSVVRALLGEENTESIELQTLANEHDAVADFHGALANIDDDLSSRKLGQGLGMFKKLSAGDRVRARRLYESGFEFDATGKQLYAANEVPDVSDDVGEDDEAFWRRWLLVEFPNHYPPSERDPQLSDKLTQPEVLSGVLNWAIEGRRRLLEQGYFTNEERYAQAKRERWQAWGDSVDQFISECVTHDPAADNISTTQAHRRYAAWCRENGVKPIGQQQLTNTLKQEDVDYTTSVRVDGKVKRGYKALGLSDAVPEIETTPERQSELT